MGKIKDYIKVNKVGQRLFYLLLAVVSFGVYVYIQLSYTMPKNKQLPPEKLFLTIVIGVVGIALIAICYYYQLSKQNNWKFDMIYQTDLKSLGIAIAGVVAIVGSQITLLAIAKPSQTSANQAILNTFLGKTNPLFYVMLGIIAPICEELIFRGMFFEIFFTKANTKNIVLGAICNGILFALIHDQKLDVFFLAYFIAGFVLALQYLMTRNISTSIITHMANNLITLII